MADKNYSKRELDAKFQSNEDVSDANRSLIFEKLEDVKKTLEVRLTNFELDTRGSLSRVELASDKINDQVAYTNGKVRKIIIALVLIGGIVIGQTMTNSEIIKTVIGLFH